MSKLTRNLALFVYYAFAQHLPMQPMPGFRIGYAVRGWLARRIFKSCGEGVIVKSKAYFGSGAEIVLGDRSQIGQNARIEHDVIFGNDVVMGPDVVIMSSSHAFDALDVPINLQGATPKRPPVIGNDVWIGTRVIILPGVTIGDGAVIGAGSIVTRDIPPLAVAVGVPARMVRYRGQQNGTDHRG
jgi:maltose O-acetyltransferase